MAPTTCGHVAREPGEAGLARQGGLGRGLEALLPSASPEVGTTQRGHGRANEDDAERAHERSGAVDTFTLDLVNDLAADGSGLALIYRALDDLVARCGLDDAAIVIEEPGLGRQVFCAGRRPLDDDEEDLLRAPTGLYTSPELGAEDIDPAALVNLCVLALRLDVLRYDAWHDPLTGLYDRRSFDRLLEMAVSRCARYGWSFTLVIVDLDALKAINDRGGHAAGDAALRSISDRFGRVLRFGDNAARIGGDEFALILPNTDMTEVPVLLDRVREEVEGQPPVPAFSFGAAYCPTEADDYDALFRLADKRLYASKEQRS